MVAGGAGEIAGDVGEIGADVGAVGAVGDVESYQLRPV